MSDQLPNIICNGELEIVKITEELYDEAVKLFTDNFMQKENLCLATSLFSSPQAIKELQSLCRELVKENISFAARNIANGELAAIVVNHLMTSQAENASLGSKMSSLQSPAMRSIIDYMQRIESNSDIYKRLEIDCVMEIVFLSTDIKYQQRGLANILTNYAINYARRLLKGTLQEEDLPAAHSRSLKPQAVCSLFTSFFTQRIGRKLGFEILDKLHFKDFLFEGETFAARIDPIHEFSTFEALRL